MNKGMSPPPMNKTKIFTNKQITKKKTEVDY